MAENPTQKENPQDILIVKNIDVGCDFIEMQSTRRMVRTRDDENNISTSFSDDIEEIPHDQYFQVKWSGQKFRIKPGDTRLYPRYIGEHFAKHLTDHILGKREVDYSIKNPGKVTALINSPLERKRVWDQIVIGVQQYFEELGEVDEGLQAFNQVEELNANPMAQELGMNPGNSLELKEDRTVQAAPKKDPMATGVSDAVVPTEDLVKKAVDDPNEAPSVGIDAESWSKTTKADLIEQIRKLDPFAKLSGNESKGQLMTKLKGF